MTQQTQPTTQLIINADDFGFSPGITDGILHAHNSGILTSTTLMTTMPDRDRAIELANANPTLGIGIHLCLTQGTPLTRCAKILNSDGTFPRSLPKLAARLLSATARHQAEEEWSAQIRYALDHGLIPTHLDSHKHIHHLPALQGIILDLAARYQIKYIRAAREFTHPQLPRLPISYRLLNHFAQSLARRAQTTHIKIPDWFYGLARTGHMNTAAWIALLRYIPAGIGEVMVHPGYTTDLTPSQTRLIAERSTELDALINPAVRETLIRQNIQLTHYGKLSFS